MSLLTDQEICAALPGINPLPRSIEFARAIEQAVIAKLATVSVEPVAWIAEYGGDVYTAEALAAARVQENERIANWYYKGGHRLSVFDVAPAIRALIGGKP